MRALLRALVLSAFLVPFTARADIVVGPRPPPPHWGDAGPQPDVSPQPDEASSSSGGCLARTSQDGLALAFAGSLSLLFVLGKRRWNRHAVSR